MLRGLQVVETACGVPSLMLGDQIEVSKDMDTYMRKLPLGVVAAVCPFNFPGALSGRCAKIRREGDPLTLTLSTCAVSAMIPLWAMAMATATGNSLILKPSERDPGATMILAELMEQAGLPKGVLQVVHGTIDPVKFICKEPRIKAISFVGGDRAGKYIHETGSKHGKRVQANLGAKSEVSSCPQDHDWRGLTFSNPWQTTASCCRTRTRTLRSTRSSVLPSELRDSDAWHSRRVRCFPARSKNSPQALTTDTLGQSSRSASRSTGSTASSSVHRSSRSARALTRRRMCKSMDLDEAILCAYSNIGSMMLPAAVL